MEKEKVKKSVKNSFLKIIAAELIFVLVLLGGIFAVKCFDKKNYRKIRAEIIKRLSVKFDEEKYFSHFKK